MWRDGDIIIEAQQANVGRFSVSISATEVTRDAERNPDVRARCLRVCPAANVDERG